MKIWFTLALTFLFSCSSPQKKAETPLSHAEEARAAAAAPAQPLTETEARTRFKQLSRVSYELAFDLDRDSDSYTGQTTVHFELRPKATGDLFVDFHGGPESNIHTLSLNGTAIGDPASRYDGNRIHFQVSELRPGANTIEISFARKYATNGHGLYHFKDPEDGKTYLYTDDEPAFAHEFFPCFDQPDLKATYQMTVMAPRSWAIATNTLETKTSIQGDKKTWVFAPTLPLSTYLVALIAGDYVSWKGDADGIPMRLFARAALKRYVDHDQKEWLDITRRGLAFYAEKFDHPYPYGKYDQILVPDFDEGAMENAGAVTFTEDLAFRTKQTRLRHLDRADIILHEMAHMWFGDLVTMKWWNGLWLNESFATFMSAWSTADATPYKESWQAFFAGDKSWAYWQDQLVTTHPIDLPVPDTDHAFSNFDGITYGKGAAVLKQLRYYLGEDNFTEGVRRYFARYAERNSTLHDFIRMLSEASDKDLDHWQAEWLRTPGVNTVRANWSCAALPGANESTIKSFDLIQENAPESQVLRSHKTQVALFEEKNGKFVPRDLIPVEYSGGKTTVSDAIGKPCPAFVYPNYGDEDYVKVELDPVSLDRMTNELRKIEDPLVRQMYWEDLWNSVVDGKLSAKKYVGTVLDNLNLENNLLVLESMLENVEQRKLARDSAMKFIPPAERAPFENRLEHQLKYKLNSAQPGSDFQLAYFNAFVEVVHTPVEVDYLRSLLAHKTRLPGLKIDQAVRWKLVAALARNGAPDAVQWADAEKKADPSHYGKLSRLEALAQIPTEQNKREWFAKIIAAGKSGGSIHEVGEELSASDLRYVMSNFVILDQESEIAPLSKDYFEYLPKAAQSPDEEFMYNYTRALYPAICEQAVVDETEKSLESDEGRNFPPQTQKHIKTHLQEEQRCIRARGVASP